MRSRLVQKKKHSQVMMGGGRRMGTCHLLVGVKGSTLSPDVRTLDVVVGAGFWSITDADSIWAVVTPAPCG